jgi:hypothetical protein
MFVVDLNKVWLFGGGLALSKNGFGVFEQVHKCLKVQELTFKK